MTDTPRAVRLASGLVLVGALLIAALYVVFMVVEPRSILRMFGDCLSLGVWVWMGTLLRAHLLAREPLGYWLFVVFWLPIVLLGGGVAVVMGAKHGFPLLGHWAIDATLASAVLLQICAAIMLMLPGNRPIVEEHGTTGP